MSRAFPIMKTDENTVNSKNTNKFDVSVRLCLLSTHTSKSNSMLGTHLHAMIRTHHFDFDVRF